MIEYTMKSGKDIKVKLTLNDEDRTVLKSILSKGVKSVRVIKRAMVLNLFDKGHPSPEIAKSVGVSPETARRIAHNYNKEGINRALYDNPRPGNSKLLSEKESNEIIAMVCSDPPEGRQRWTLELLKKEAMHRKIVRTVGRETIRILLKKHDLKPWLKKNVVRSKVNR